MSDSTHISPPDSKPAVLTRYVRLERGAPIAGWFTSPEEAAKVLNRAAGDTD